jgi:hypothetical protein
MFSGEKRQHLVRILTLKHEECDCEGSNKQGAQNVHPEAKSVACAQEKRPSCSVVILKAKNIIQFGYVMCPQVKISTKLYT